MGRGLLIIVSGLFIVYGIIQKSLNDRQTTITQYSANYAGETQSNTIANAMADLAFAEINQNPGDQDAGSFPEMEIAGGTGKVDVRFETPEPQNPFLQHKILTAVGTYNGRSDTVVVRTMRRAFSRYSYFTVQEPTIYFTDGDILNGPVHTNGTIHVNGDAVFNGPVSAAQGCDGCDDHDPQFNQGADLNADEINLPIQVPELADAANSDGLRFTNNIEIDFISDGTADIIEFSRSCIDSRWWGCAEWQTTEISSDNYNLSSYNGIISTSEKVEVKGTLNGDVTIHSEKDVEIMGDLRYDHIVNPPDEPNPDEEDFLGIVSEGQTIVDKDAHTVEGNGDLDIHASIMALAEDASFMVEDYNDGNQRGYLNILGGLVQYERGPVGTSGGTGFFKNYTYDERFLGRSPRGFPRSDIFDFISWKTEYGNHSQTSGNGGYTGGH